MTHETTTDDIYDITLVPGGAQDPRLQWEYFKGGSLVGKNQLVITPTGPGTITFALSTVGYQFREDYKPVVTGKGRHVITCPEVISDGHKIKFTVVKDLVLHDQREIHIILIVQAADGSIHASPDPTVDPQNDGCPPHNDGAA